MKKIKYLLFLFLLIGCSNKKINNVKNADAIIDDIAPIADVEIVSNLEFEYASDIYLYDLISNIDDVRISTNNEKIDTMSLGDHTINIEYKSGRDIINKELNYKVVDKTKPLLLVSSSYSVEKGSNTNLVNKAVCADNHDKRPNCYIEGKYNLNKIGTYNLVYHAIDSSGNSSSKSFKLNVVKPSKSTSTPDKPKYKIEDLISKHKKDNTMIGIDVSSWQNNVDYSKVKDAGVEFVMIRLGYGHNKSGELVLDKQFKNNIKNAKAAGLKVGIYFYSYANTIDKVKEQVKYIVNNLNGEKLDLPIAFDWEDWKNFNTYNMSLTDIRIIAQTFIDEVEKNGYEGILYSSKYYLEQIWGVDKYKTWLAHYTSETSYKGKYMIWQLSSRGKVPGISGNVDLDILYK